jgi:hypothetical protein
MIPRRGSLPTLHRYRSTGHQSRRQSWEAYGVRGSSLEGSDCREERAVSVDILEKPNSVAQAPCPVCKKSCGRGCDRCKLYYHVPCDEAVASAARLEIGSRAKQSEEGDWAQTRWLRIVRHNLQLKSGRRFQCSTCIVSRDQTIPS